MARWSSVEAAIDAAETSSLSRVMAGIPIMLQYSREIYGHAGDIPFGLLIVKGAFESKGNPATTSATDSLGRKAVGLFQLYTGLQGLSVRELQDPEINTGAFVELMRERARTLEKSHAEYFTNGRDYQFWTTVLWTTMIGPGAVRTILDATRPSRYPFDTAIRYIQDHPSWMEHPSVEPKFGVQGGRLVAFRSIITRRMAGMARAIVPVIEDRPVAVAPIALLAVVALAAILWG